MARLARVEHPNAIYHIASRSESGRKLFNDADHYEHFTEGLIEEVDRSSWLVLAYCWTPDQVHALIRTPQMNLRRGMHRWLSSYTNWYAKRNQGTGSLFYGRYKAYPVQDESYYWDISRYIHLMPCCGNKPIAADPDSYCYSSYAGYARKNQRVDWIAYDEHHRHWLSLNNGKDPSAAYRKYVKDGLKDPAQAEVTRLRSWVYGGDKFLKKMQSLAAGKKTKPSTGGVKKSNTLTVKQIMSTVAQFYDVDPRDYGVPRKTVAGKDLAAYLCKRFCNITSRELTPHFGLTHPLGASNLVHRAKGKIEESDEFRRDCKKIEQQLRRLAADKA